jgi:hypothetical protein
VPTLFRLTLVCASTLVFGCGSPLGSAIDAFQAGRLPEAARDLRSLATRAERFEGHELWRYALYRGLTELSLGDIERAERYLIPLKRQIDSEPQALSDAERGALFAAFRSMGRMPGEP